MSLLASQIMGDKVDLSEVTVASGIPPIDMPGLGTTRQKLRPFKKRTDADDKKVRKYRNGVAAAIIGMHEDNEFDRESLIPDESKKISDHDIQSSGLDLEEVPETEEEPSSPDLITDEEGLIHPATILIAPDATPDATKPLDPMMVPGTEQGEAPAAQQAPPAQSPFPTQEKPVIDTVLGRTQPVVTAEAAMAMLPGISAVPGGSALLKQGELMPDHVPSSGRAVMESFRKFGPK